MNSSFMAGVAAKFSSLTEVDLHRMQDAGIGWLRSEIKGLDQACFFRGDAQPEKFERLRNKSPTSADPVSRSWGLPPVPGTCAPRPGRRARRAI